MKEVVSHIENIVLKGLKYASAQSLFYVCLSQCHLTAHRDIFLFAAGWTVLPGDLHLVLF